MRIARAAAELRTHSVAVYATDDGAGKHVQLSDEVRALPGAGVQAYLDIDAILDVATATGCDKHRARGLARHVGVPVLPGTDEPTTVAQACFSRSTT